MKWVGINNLGCTWEPKAHFIGTDAKFKFEEYVRLKEVKAEKAEKRREDLLAGKLVVSCKPSDDPNDVSELAKPTRATGLAVKSVSFGSRSRHNASIVWEYFNGGPRNPEKW